MWKQSQVVLNFRGNCTCDNFKIWNVAITIPKINFSQPIWLIYLFAKIRNPTDTNYRNDIDKQVRNPFIVHVTSFPVHTRMLHKLISIPVASSRPAATGGKPDSREQTNNATVVANGHYNRHLRSLDRGVIHRPSCRPFGYIQICRSVSWP